jgi:hypothetical protein
MVHHRIKGGGLTVGKLKWWSIGCIRAGYSPNGVGEKLKANCNVLLPGLTLEPEVKGRAALFVQFLPINLKQHIP